MTKLLQCRVFDAKEITFVEYQFIFKFFLESKTKFLTLINHTKL